MRQVDPMPGVNDNLLGRKVERPKVQPAPQPKPTGTPGVFEMPDGKLETRLPEPKPLRVHDSIYMFGDY
jgi:hypothetical protein